MNERFETNGQTRTFPANGKGFLFAPVLWFVWFLAIYAVQGAGCGLQLDGVGVLGMSALRLMLAVMTIAVAAAIAAVGMRSFSSWRRLREVAEDAGGRPRDHAEFLAYGALLNAALFLVAVVWVAVPLAAQDLCHL